MCIYFASLTHILWNGFQSIAPRWRFFPFRQINMHMQFLFRLFSVYKCKLNVSFRWDQQWWLNKNGSAKNAMQVSCLYIVCLYFEFNYKLKPNNAARQEKAKKMGILCSSAIFDANGSIRIGYKFDMPFPRRRSTTPTTTTTIYFHFVIESRL